MKSKWVNRAAKFLVPLAIAVMFLFSLFAHTNAQTIHKGTGKREEGTGDFLTKAPALEREEIEKRGRHKASAAPRALYIFSLYPRQRGWASDPFYSPFPIPCSPFPVPFFL